MAMTNFSKPMTMRVGAVSNTKTILMKLNRNFTLASTLGHMITFKKDKPIPIPSVMVRACAEIGAERVDGGDAFEQEEAEQVVQPVDPGEREDDVLEAIEKLIETNLREDFTAAGMPTVSAVTREVGYKIDRTEINKVWRQRAEDLANDSG